MVIKMKILLGTKNNHKVYEMTKIIQEFFPQLPDEITIISLNDLPNVDEPVEDGNTFLVNATIKAKYYYDKFKIPTIADDSGLEVAALNGLPGVYSARFASMGQTNSLDKDNREKLLTMLKDVEDRRARFVCAIVYFDGNELVSAEGQTTGKILREETGDKGFGYDCLFYSDDLEKPFGLADSSEKNRISHRGRALRKLLIKIN